MMRDNNREKGIMSDNNIEKWYDETIIEKKDIMIHNNREKGTMRKKNN